MIVHVQAMRSEMRGFGDLFVSSMPYHRGGVSIDVSTSEMTVRTDSSGIQVALVTLKEKAGPGHGHHYGKIWFQAASQTGPPFSMPWGRWGNRGSRRYDRRRVRSGSANETPMGARSGIRGAGGVPDGCSNTTGRDTIDPVSMSVCSESQIGPMAGMEE